MGDIATKADEAFSRKSQRAEVFQVRVVEGPIDLSTLPYVEDRKFLFWTWKGGK